MKPKALPLGELVGDGSRQTRADRSNTLPTNPGKATGEKHRAPPAQAPHQGLCRHHAPQHGAPRQVLRFSPYQRETETQRAAALVSASSDANPDLTVLVSQLLSSSLLSKGGGCHAFKRRTGPKAAASWDVRVQLPGTPPSIFPSLAGVFLGTDSAPPSPDA